MIQKYEFREEEFCQKIETLLVMLVKWNLVSFKKSCFVSIQCLWITALLAKSPVALGWVRWSGSSSGNGKRSAEVGVALGRIQEAGGAPASRAGLSGVARGQEVPGFAVQHVKVGTWIKT